MMLEEQWRDLVHNYENTKCRTVTHNPPEISDPLVWSELVIRRKFNTKYFALLTGSRTSQYKTEFSQFMKNRLVMGEMRYGSVGGFSLRLVRERMTRFYNNWTLELLVDVVNIDMLTYSTTGESLLIGTLFDPVFFYSILRENHDFTSSEE